MKGADAIAGSIFNLWKIEDSKSLQDSLLKQYHQLSVSIANEANTLNNSQPHAQSSQSTETEAESTTNMSPHDQLTHERIQVLNDCKESLLYSARLLGGDDLVDYIQQHQPVVIDLHALCEQYTKAFWDQLNDEFKQN